MVKGLLADDCTNSLKDSVFLTAEGSVFHLTFEEIVHLL